MQANLLFQEGFYFPKKEFHDYLNIKFPLKSSSPSYSSQIPPLTPSPTIILAPASSSSSSYVHYVNSGYLKMVMDAVNFVALNVFAMFAVGVFLSVITSTFAPKEVISIILAPLIEEVLFRGVLLPTIHLVQYVWYSYISPISPNATQDQKDEALRKQQMFRVHASAFIFAYLHLSNFKNPVAKVITFCSAYFGGITYAYLTEKYKSLAPSFLAHGLNNFIVICPLVPLPMLFYLVNEIGFYILAKKKSVNNTSQGQLQPQVFQQPVLT